MNSTQIYNEYTQPSTFSLQSSDFTVWNQKYPDQATSWKSYTASDVASQYADLYKLDSGSVVCVQMNGTDKIKEFEIKTQTTVIYSVKEIVKMTNDERNNAQELYDEYRLLGFDKQKALKLVRNASGLNNFIPVGKDE
jgi:hypothetical protein